MLSGQQTQAEKLATDLRVVLYGLKNTDINKDTVTNLESALLSAINKLPDNADQSVYDLFILFLTAPFTLKPHGLVTSDSNVLKGLTTKDALIAKAKEIIELFKYKQNHLSLLTEEPDPKDKSSINKYFKKMYYHGSQKTHKTEVADKIAEINAEKLAVSKQPCSLDQLQASNCNLKVDGAIIELNNQFKFYVIDPLLTTQDPDKRDEEKALLTALLKQHEDNIQHPNILRRLGQFFGWSVPRKILAGKTYTVEVPNDRGNMVKRKVRLTNDILIQHEEIYNGHTLHNDLSPRFRIISNQKPLGKGVHGTTYACVGTIKFRDDDIESKHQSSLVIKELNQHMKAIIVRDTPSFVAGEANFLRMLVSKAKKVVFEKRTVFSAKSYIVDERFNGQKLSDIIEEQTTNPASSKDDVWLTNVTSNLLHYLMRIHSLDIIHHDIWTDNIMANANGEARIIDLGGAMNTGDILQYGGRHEYRAPEIDLISFGALSLSFRPFVKQSSDTYMLGKSLVELWSTNANVSTDRTVAKLEPYLKVLQARAKHNTHAQLKVVAKARKGLEKTLDGIRRNKEATTPAAKIVVMLASMMHSNSELRPHLEDTVLPKGNLQKGIISQLEDIRLEGKSIEVKNAFTHALKTHADLLKLQASDPQFVSGLGTMLNTAIDNIVNDTPDVIQEFIRTIRIKVFSNIPNKAELKAKTDDIVNKFNTNLQALNSLFNQISATLKVAKSLPPAERKTVNAELTPLLDDINHRIHKARHCPRTLDDLNAFNEKMVKEDILKTLKDKLDAFDAKPQAISTQCKILRRLSCGSVSQANAAKDVMKNSVKLAIRDYLVKAKPKQERLIQIEGVLTVLAGDFAAKTSDALKTEVEGVLGLGKFSVFTRGSTLPGRIRDALKIGSRAR